MGLVGSGVGLDGHAQPVPTELRAEVLGLLQGAVATTLAPPVWISQACAFAFGRVIAGMTLQSACSTSSKL